MMNESRRATVTAQVRAECAEPAPARRGAHPGRHQQRRRAAPSSHRDARTVLPTNTSVDSLRNAERASKSRKQVLLKQGERCDLLLYLVLLARDQKRL